LFSWVGIEIRDRVVEIVVVGVGEFGGRVEDEGFKVGVGVHEREEFIESGGFANEAGKEFGGIVAKKSMLFLRSCERIYEIDSRPIRDAHRAGVFIKWLAFARKIPV